MCRTNGLSDLAEPVWVVGPMDGTAFAGFRTNGSRTNGSCDQQDMGPIVPFYKDFSPSGEQLEQRKLAHEL